MAIKSHPLITLNENELHAIIKRHTVKGEIIWYLSLTIWLISLNIILSSSIHAVANDPAILLLGLYPKNPETLIQKNLCTPMFIAAQLTIAKYWKQPKCPSENEWIQKLWYIYTMEFYAAAEKEGAYTLCNSMDGTGEHYAK